MPIFFAKIEKKIEHYDFIDPVLLVHSKFPILPICKKPFYFFIFSDSYFPESEHVFKKVDNGYQLDGNITYKIESCFEKYFPVSVDTVFFYLQSIKEDSDDWFELQHFQY